MYSVVRPCIYTQLFCKILMIRISH